LWYRARQRDPARTADYLEEALRRNPRHIQATLDLAAGLTFSHPTRASRLLDQASRYDRGFRPAWAQANFQATSGSTEHAWPPLRHALRMSYGDRTPLFQLASGLPGGHRALASEIPDNTMVFDQWTRYLITTGDLEMAANAARRGLDKGLYHHSQPVELLADRLLLDGQGREADSLWSGLYHAGLLRPPHSGFFNGDFYRIPSGIGFDWRLISGPGTSSTTGQGAVNLRFETSRPAEVLTQFLYVPASQNALLRFELRASPPAATAWFHGSVLAGGGIPAAEEWNEHLVRLRLPAGLNRLAFRLVGPSTGGSQVLQVRSLRLEPVL